MNIEQIPRSARPDSEGKDGSLLLPDQKCKKGKDLLLALYIDTGLIS
jgi:hypothetical protein